jgi:hypothetical protein
VLPVQRSHARLPALLPALLIACLVVVTAVACNRSSSSSAPTSDASGHVQVYVTNKVMPVGMLVATAKATDIVERKSIPADVAGADALASLDGLDCLVAGQSLPAGTVVRRNQLVEPKDIGLNRGLTGNTDARPAGC